MALEYRFAYMDAFHKRAFEDAAAVDYYLPGQPGAVVVEKGIILPYKKTADDAEAAGGVLDESGQFVSASAQHVVGEDITHGYSPREVEASSRKVIYFGPFHAHWGHFLTEMVTRCWYLCKEIDWSEWYVAYIKKSDTSLKDMGGSYLEFLELLGVPADRVFPVERPTRFCRVVVPEVSNEPGKYYRDAFVGIFDKIREGVMVEDPGDPKVYFTRLKTKGLRNTQIGEKDICRIFRKNGYRIVAPERLSLREQVGILKQCEELVVIEGTLAHNILFAKPGIRLTVINRVCGMNAYQPFINQAREARVTYVDAHLSFFPVFAGGPFLLYVSDELRRYAVDHRLHMGGKKESGFILHCKVVWYFLCYMDHMTGDCIRRWRLKEAFGDSVLEQYAFYRDKCRQYDQGLWPKLRKAFYRLAKGIVD